MVQTLLHKLDRLIRYADDAVVLCGTEAQEREALWRIGIILSRLKVTLHPTKTQVVYIGDGRQGIDFLGFHYRKVESWKYRGERYPQRWPAPGRYSAFATRSTRSLRRGIACLNL